MKRTIRFYFLITISILVSSCHNDDDLSRCDEDDGFLGSEDNLILLEPERNTYNVGDVLSFTFEVNAVNSIVSVPNFNMLVYTGKTEGELRLPDYFQFFEGNSITFIRGSFSGLNTVLVPFDSATGNYRAVAEITLNKTGSYSFISDGIFLLNGGDCEIVEILSNVQWSIPRAVQFEVLP